jgi:beta-barrel assembly-enhancing protease
MLNSLSKNKSGSTNLLFSTHPMSDERFRAAQESARTKYQASQSLPLNGERYMDNTSRLRQIKDAVEAMQKSDTAMGAQKYDEAEAYLRKALKQVPGDYAGLLMMAKCQLAQGNNDEAQQYADQAKQAYPREAQAYHVSGFAKLKGNSFDAAYQDFSRCEQLLPKNPGIAFFKGLALEGMGRRDQSAAEYNRYLQSVKEGDNAKHAYQRLVEWGYIKK